MEKSRGAGHKSVLGRLPWAWGSPLEPTQACLGLQGTTGDGDSAALHSLWSKQTKDGTLGSFGWPRPCRPSGAPSPGSAKPAAPQQHTSAPSEPPGWGLSRSASSLGRDPKSKGKPRRAICWLWNLCQALVRWKREQNQRRAGPGEAAEQAARTEQLSQVSTGVGMQRSFGAASASQLCSQSLP